MKRKVLTGDLKVLNLGTRPKIILARQEKNDEMKTCVERILTIRK
jgi:hypothetical protein